MYILYYKLVQCTYVNMPYLPLGHVDEARVAILDRDDKLLAIRVGSTTYGTSVRRSKRRFCVINKKGARDNNTRNIPFRVSV